MTGQTIVNVSPGVGNQGQTFQVTISGQNTHFNQGTQTSIFFAQGSSTIIYPSSTTVNSATQVQGQFTFTYSHPTGWYTTYVYDQVDGMLSSPSSFFLMTGANPPQLISVNPNSAMKGQTLTVTVSGQNTHFQQASYTVWFNQGSATIAPISTSVISNVEMEAEFFFHYSNPLGLYNVNTYNPIDNNLTLPASFTLLPASNPPMIYTVNPDTLQLGVSGTLMVLGSNTHFMSASQTAAYVENGSSFGNFNMITAVNDTVLLLSGPFFSVPEGWYNVHVYNDYDDWMVMNNAVYLYQTGVGIQDRGFQLFHAYPNPYNEELYLDLANFSERVTVVAYSTDGKKVLHQEIDPQPQPVLLNMGGLPKGVYLLEVKSRVYSEYLKVIRN